MTLKNVKFITSAANKTGWIDDDIKEIVLLGRSNVGKSTFINRITGNGSIAKVSSTPGRTRLLNFFDIDSGAFRIVDAPGYGYAGVSRQNDQNFAIMMSDYLSNRKNLVGAVLLLDARRIPNQDDVDVYDILIENKIPFFIVATKYDKLNQSERSLLERNFQNELSLPPDSNIIHSCKNDNDWLDETIDEIYKLIRRE